MLNALKIVLFTLTLTACSWTDIMGLLSPSGGVDTELVVGDKNQEVHTEIGKQTANTIVNESDNWFPWLVACAAFMLPTPTRMYYIWRNRNATV